jgi:hypothetical protein
MEFTQGRLGWAYGGKKGLRAFSVLTTVYYRFFSVNNMFGVQQYKVYTYCESRAPTQGYTFLVSGVSFSHFAIGFPWLN